MAEFITTINLNQNLVLAMRNILNANAIHSLDVNQTNGRVLITEPYNSNGSIGGAIVMYPQSIQLDLSPVVRMDYFGDQFVYFPYDAKFDYVRGKIWILDTGNHRIISVNESDQSVNFILEDKMYYPHSVAVNLNTGGAFVKGFSNAARTIGKVIYFLSSGVEKASFEFGGLDNSSSSSSSLSSSSSSSSSENQSGSEESNSSTEETPVLPSYRSIVYDHVRSRAWWVSDNIIYMLDERNKQVQTYDVIGDYFSSVQSIDIEFQTGNAFVVAKDRHLEDVIIQASRDNSGILAHAYVGV